MKKNISLFLIITFLFQIQLFGGSYLSNSTNGKSPGLVDLGGSARSIGSGYGLMSVPNDFVLNSANFAAWGFRQNTQFTFSFNSSYYQLDIPNLSNQWSDFAIDNIALNIPLIKKEWSLGMGLSPVTNSNIGFRVNNDLGEIIQRYEGSFIDGYFVSSYKFHKHLSISTGFIFTFGNISDEFKIITNSDLNLNDLNSTISYQGRMPNIVLGFQYDDSTFQCSSQAIIPFKGEMAIVESSPGSTAPDALKDLKMPFRFSGGIGYTFDHFRVGISGKYENWQNGYAIDNVTFTKDLTDMILIGGGFETVPERRLFESGWEKIQWRFGFHGAILNNKENYSVIKEYAVHAGLGIPFNAYFSNIDLGFEFGQRGDLNVNLAKEIYFKIGFSFTAGERWFISLDEY